MKTIFGHRNRAIVSKTRCVFAAAAVVLFAAGCVNESYSIRAALSESGAAQSAGRVALPYVLVTKYTNRGEERRWEDPALTDRMAAGLVSRGYRVLDRAYIRDVLEQQGSSPAELFDEKNIPSLGKKLGADIIVLVRYTIVERKDGTVHDKKLTLRGIRVADGEVAMAVSAVDTSRYAQLKGEQLVDAALGGLFGANAKETGADDAGESAEGQDAPGAGAERTTGASGEASATASLKAGS